MMTTDLRDTWEVKPGVGARKGLPLDPVSPTYRPPTFCQALSPIHGWVCTRPVGHTRRHAASTGHYFLAVWP